MISVIIPVYKNKELFLTNIKHNLKFLEEYEIIVINDDPSSSLKNDLAQFKKIQLFENNNNLGFGETVNKGVQQAKNQYIMLLNSDVKLLNDNYKQALNLFDKDKGLFAVSFVQEEKNKTLVGKNLIYWQNGFIAHQKNTDLSFGYNAWAEGGACIIDKLKFIEMKGFDPIYSPFYWEDIDLSYRAWKRGYNILFDPLIKVEHQHESTISKYFDKKQIDKIAYRNQLLFIWKNITDKKLIFNHMIYLIPTIMKAFLKGNFALVNGFIEALLRINPVLKQRRIERKSFVKLDFEILNLFKILM